MTSEAPDAISPEAIVQAAARLIAARDAGGPVARLPARLRPRTEAEGYAIQDEAIRQRRAAGRVQGGWKIGCTTAAMQEMLGLDGPAAGAVYGGDIHASPATLAAAALCHPVVECEIAVRMAAELAPRAGGHDRESVAPYVGACMAAIELAELRLPEREDMTVGELVADDFFQKAVVLGPELGDWRALDLARLAATTDVAGDRRGEGVGGDVMGHPFAALAWLADVLAARGKALKQGEVVLTGSIVAATAIGAGESAVCAIAGLGQARLTLARAAAC